MTNGDRAQRAEAALIAYVNHTGDSIGANELGTWIADLMGDLRHLCAALAQEFPDGGGAEMFTMESEEDSEGFFAPTAAWYLEREPPYACMASGQHRDTGRGVCADCGAVI